MTNNIYQQRANEKQNTGRISNQQTVIQNEEKDLELKTLLLNDQFS